MSQDPHDEEVMNSVMLREKLRQQQTAGQLEEDEICHCALCVAARKPAGLTTSSELEQLAREAASGWIYAVYTWRGRSPAFMQTQVKRLTQVILSVCQKAQELTRKEGDRAEHWLGEILAVIHCDGGHYQAEHGIEKATKDAISKRNAMVQRIDQLESGAATADKLLHEATRILANESLRNDETVRQQFYDRVNRSDQPTSGKQEQEWTAKTVAKIIDGAADFEAEWTLIADAHNASITAEREKVQKLKQWHEDIAQQLAAAQAAIAKHNAGHPKGCRLEYADTTALDAATRARFQEGWEQGRQQGIELAAAAQQPLVECLNYYAQDAGQGSTHHKARKLLIDLGFWPKPKLAKVKEGK